jgi:quercetin 2,3-dioxygenase
MNAPQQLVPSSPLVVPAGAGPFFELGDHRGNVKVSAQHCGGDFALLDTVADPQGGVPLHVHSREEETFYILEGQFAIQVGDQTILAGPGDTVFGPRNIAHSWFCVSDTPGRFFLLITPGANFETFAGEMARRNFVPARDMADPVLAAEFLALTSAYGIHMLPPDKAAAGQVLENLALRPVHEPVYVPAGGGTFAELGDHRGWAKVGAQHTGGAFLLGETQADPQGGVPPHIHRREDETFYILNGRFTFMVGGETVEVGPGDTIFAPRDIVHTWRCTSENGGRLLAVFTPGDNFQTFALTMAEQNANPQTDMADPARAAAFVALAARHGIEMVPPTK